MKMPFSRLTVLKLPKTKKFEYTPRHYDEQKERLEERKKRIAEEMGLSERNPNEKREINFRAKLSSSKMHRQRRSSSMWMNLRLLVILIILLTICYYIYINLENVLGAIVD